MKALIVGGGIAGPATALALAKVGIEPVVLERRAVVDPEVGSWFTVAPNGLSALYAIDLLKVAQPCTGPPDEGLAGSASAVHLTTVWSR